MQITKVRVDGAEFFLPEDQVPKGLQSKIVSAVRAGGDFVTFNTLGRGPIRVLCASGIPIRFETVERSDEEIGDRQTDLSSFDFDYFPPLASTR